jgi:thiol-disulfide isomerase/thioredoxin
MVTALGTGWVFTTIFLRIAVILAFWICLRYKFSIWSWSRKVKGWIVFLIALFGGFGISMISPIYQGDYGYVQNETPNLDIQRLSDATNGKFALTEGHQVVTFFEINCPHCRDLCNKIGMNISGGQKAPVTAFFMAVPQAQIDKFLSDNNGSKMNGFPLDPPVFLDNGGYSFPSTFLIDKTGKVVNHWKGDSVNYSALDYLMDLE